MNGDIEQGLGVRGPSFPGVAQRVVYMMVEVDYALASCIYTIECLIIEHGIIIRHRVIIRNRVIIRHKVIIRHRVLIGYRVNTTEGVKY